MVRIFDRLTNPRVERNFKAAEFYCHCGECQKQKIDSDLIALLQEFRDRVGVAVKISSGYRCPAHNATIPNAVKGSYHTKGMAADIKVVGFTPAALAKIAEEVGFKGIGTYHNRIHVDVRKTKRAKTWNG